MRDHESLLLLRGLAFPSAPTVRASRLRGQGQLGGPRLPRRSYTPRHARLDPRARHRDPDRWLNTEARWRARWSAGGEGARKNTTDEGLEAPAAESVRPAGSPRRRHLSVSSLTPHGPPARPPAGAPRAPRASGRDGTAGPAVSGPAPRPGLGPAPSRRSPVRFPVERSVRRRATHPYASARLTSRTGSVT